jgi:hypothetical protein
MIFSSYAAYQTRNFEWLTEGILMRDNPGNDHPHWTPAGYTQVSRKFGKFRPYARLEWRNSPVSDPILATIGANYTTWGPSVGVRYDFTPMMALKAEFEREMQTGVPAVDQLTLQWTFRY